MTTPTQGDTMQGDTATPTQGDTGGYAPTVLQVAQSAYHDELLQFNPDPDCLLPLDELDSYDAPSGDTLLDFLLEELGEPADIATPNDAAHWEQARQRIHMAIEQLESVRACLYLFNPYGNAQP